MPRFRFKLEAVLDQRRAVERSRQVVVADLERRRMDIEQSIRGYHDQIARERDDLRAHLVSERHGPRAGGVDLRGVRLQAGASLHLVARAHQAVLQLAGVHGRLEAARLELIAATTRRRAVEVLRERRLHAWTLEQSRLENAAEDELATMHARRTDAGSEEIEP